MRGQWTGLYTGRNAGDGFVTVDLDQIGDYVEGWATTNPADLSHPAAMAKIKLPKDLKDKTELTVDVSSFNRATNEAILSSSALALPQKAKISFERSESALIIQAVTDIETGLSANLTRSDLSAPSLYAPGTNSWSEFRAFAQLEPYRKFVYRGQSKPYRLRTSFHRTGRADMRRYNQVDIPALHRHLSAQTQQPFNIDMADHRGAFLNLVQHHGYPTPLLDWTYSPFIAAFFAFQKIENPAGVVRVIRFDHEHWLRTNPLRLANMNALIPHFSMIEFVSSIDNKRQIPQQSASSITNVADIELYLSDTGKFVGYDHLKVFDMPMSERRVAMRDLDMMGITAGSLFPGLDGACEEFRERMF